MILAPGSFGWLVRHEMRVAWRGGKGGTAARWIGGVLLAIWVGAGVLLAVALEDTPIPSNLYAFAIIAALSATILSLMTTQAVIGSQQTLYGSGDLDLLLTAPVPPRTVLAAKLVGIAGSVALTYAAILLPVLLPVALIGHPRLLGGAVLLAALALIAAALGFAVTLVLARVAGPRAARTVGQVAAALMGGAAFLATQFGGRRSGNLYGEAYRWMRDHGLATGGWPSWPGRAAFGEPLPLLAVVAIGSAMFALVGTALQRAFLSGYQDAGMRFGRRRAGTRPMRRLFHAGLFRSVFAKEWRLLLRDPALLFQVLLRLVYMAPIVLIAFRDGARAIPAAPMLAFASVLIAGQLAGSFAWLTISGEDAPELLAVAPVDKREADRAKLIAALALAAPFALVLPVAIGLTQPLGALATLAMTLLGGAGAGYIELTMGKPAPRSTFAKRQKGSVFAAILSFVIAGLCGGIAAVAVWLLGP